MKRITFVLVFFALFGIGGTVHADTMPSASSIISYVNDARVSNGLAPFSENVLLDRAADSKARALASTGVLVHTTAPAGVAWATLANVGYVYVSAGENLAANIEDAGTLVNDWMNSPSHRANLLNTKYSDVGVGVAQGYYQGVQADFVVLYAAEPKVDVAAQIEHIHSLLSFLTNYLLSLTAVKAEAAIHP